MEKEKQLVMEKEVYEAPKCEVLTIETECIVVASGPEVGEGGGGDLEIN